MVTHAYRAEVHALLAFLDQVPGELIELRSVEYLEFTRCQAVLGVPRWPRGRLAHIGEPRRHVLPALGRRQPADMRGSDPRQALFHFPVLPLSVRDFRDHAHP
jgi:hypothetical protein